VVRPAGSASRPPPAAAVRVRDVVRVRDRVRVVAALTSNNGTSCACGGRDDGRRPANREKWRSGRIVPPRTRRPPRWNRGIMRMPPGTSDARTRTILPERQNWGRGAPPATITTW